MNCELFIKWLGIIGLILDIAGVVMLFFYGLPSDLNAKGHIFKVLEEVDEKEIIKYKKYKTISNVALTIILIGFVLQLISSIKSVL